ncbi:MAG: DNA replication/repair protein RecF [Candidatus Eremiobacterota bacterium]
MRLTHLDLTGFRIYRELSLDLPDGLNVLWGGNAQGKTAFLEALYLLATSRSFRTRTERELIHWEAGEGRIQAVFQRDSGRQRQLEFLWRRPGLERQVRLMGQPVRKLSEFLGEVLLSLFTPGDLALVQGGPEERRRYMDLILCKLYPTYLGSLLQYQRVVRQRNELLRRQARAVELEPWDVLLERHAALLLDRRAELCRQLDPWFRNLYVELSGEPQEVSLRYAPQSTDIRADLAARRPEELRQRTTLVGPHRDEVPLRLGDRSLRRFGSQGQQRTAVLALRLAEAKALQERSGEGALVLLDDCLSELDAARQARLLQALTEVRQVFLTTAVAPPPLSGHIWRVQAGQVFPA